MVGRYRCRMHGGLSTGPKTAENVLAETDQKITKGYAHLFEYAYMRALREEAELLKADGVIGVSFQVDPVQNGSWVVVTATGTAVR